jgi:hypothetical protein
VETGAGADAEAGAAGDALGLGAAPNEKETACERSERKEWARERRELALKAVLGRVMNVLAAGLKSASPFTEVTTGGGGSAAEKLNVEEAGGFGEESPALGAGGGGAPNENANFGRGAAGAAATSGEEGAVPPSSETVSHPCDPTSCDTSSDESSSSSSSSSESLAPASSSPSS